MVDLVQQALNWMVAGTLLIFVAVHGGVYYVATTPATALPGVVLGTMALGLLIVAASTDWVVWALPKRIRNQSGGGDDGGDGEAYTLP